MPHVLITFRNKRRLRIGATPIWLDFEISAAIKLRLRLSLFQRFACGIQNEQISQRVSILLFHKPRKGPTFICTALHFKATVVGFLPIL